MTVNVFSPSVYFMGIPSAPVHEWGQDVKTLCAADKLIPASLPALESIGEYYYYYSRQWNVAPHDEGLPIAKKLNEELLEKKGYWLLTCCCQWTEFRAGCPCLRGSASNWATRKERVNEKEKEEEEEEGAQAQAHCRHQLASLACQCANLLQSFLLLKTLKDYYFLQASCPLKCVANVCLSV